jgi:hypothetical protein
MSTVADDRAFLHSGHARCLAKIAELKTSARVLTADEKQRLEWAIEDAQFFEKELAALPKV